MALPLEGILVVDFSEAVAGPFASMLLADQGANVIKVERPGKDSPDTAVLNSLHLSYNRNKRSMSIDIDKRRGREVLDKLVKIADIFVINMRMGARRRKRLTYEDLAAINPRIIYASITAYGELGPDANRPGLDETVQARVGDAWARLTPNGPPPTSGPVHYDRATALLSFGAVMLALYQRDRTGRGQDIKLSILQTALALQASNMTRVGASRGSAIRDAKLPIGFPCKDGRYIFAKVSGPYNTDGGWERFCRAQELDNLIADPRFDTAEKRLQNADALYEVMARHFGTKTAEEWEGLLKADDLIADIVKEIPEVHEDPQVIANQMMIQFDQPGLGVIENVSFPFKFRESVGEQHPPRHVPGKGEHTYEILGELGYGSAEWKALEADGALG